MITLFMYVSFPPSFLFLSVNFLIIYTYIFVTPASFLDTPLVEVAPGHALIFVLLVCVCVCE